MFLRSFRFTAILIAIALSPSPPAFGASGAFVVFPKAGRLVSPDNRYEVRDEEPVGSGSEFIGNFHSLWLIESGTGLSRKLCDYFGTAAVTWSDENHLLITEYVGKKTSRALLFMSETLRSNDHVFIEAARLEKSIFYLRVWGYGQQNPKGFKWNCQYVLGDGMLTCNVD